MACFNQPCCPEPVPCPPPITITVNGQQRCDKKTVFVLPAVNIVGKCPGGDGTLVCCPPPAAPACGGGGGGGCGAAASGGCGGCKP